MTSAPVPVPAPGMRVLVRDAEWVVRRVDMTSGGAYQLVCDGVSELVREQEAVYLSSLEEIEVLAPGRTRLTPDRSPGFADSPLYMESQLRDRPERRTHPCRPPGGDGPRPLSA